MTLEQVFSSLDKNQYISNEYKTEIKSIISLIVETYPETNLEFIADRLSTLKVEEGLSFIFKNAIDYKPLYNTITVNKVKEQDYDRKNLLTYALVKMAFSKGELENEKFTGINAGVCSQISNMLVGNLGDKTLNQDELYATNLICSIVGVHAVERAFITKDYSQLEEIFKQEMTSSQENKMKINLSDINNKINYNYSYRKVDDSYKCDFANIEKDLVNVLFSKERSESQIEFFETNLITNCEYMDNKDRYLNVNEVGQYYKEAKDNYEKQFIRQEEMVKARTL